MYSTVFCFVQLNEFFSAQSELALEQDPSAEAACQKLLEKAPAKLLEEKPPLLFLLVIFQSRINLWIAVSACKKGWSYVYSLRPVDAKKFYVKTRKNLGRKDKFANLNSEYKYSLRHICSHKV